MNVLFPPCRLCGEAHPELSCTQYRTPDERQSRVRSLNRCTQCLDATDLDHDGLCPNDRRCLKCSGAHHEALCAVQFTAPLGTSQSGADAASSTTALPSFRFTTSKSSVQPPAPFQFTLSPVKPKFHPDPPIPQPNSKTEEKDATCAAPISSATNAPETGSKNNTGTMASSGDLFEQNKPSLFGSSQQNVFGTTTPSTRLFRSGIAGAHGAPTGTTIKFDAPRDKDTIMQNNEMQWIDTRHVCITAMREYDAKSFEELRMEDYLAHRKSGTAGGTSLVRSQQAAPTLGSTAGATGGGGLCGGLSQNTPRLVSDPSAKTARPVVSCASSTSSPISSKSYDVKAPAVQHPAGNPTKRGGPAATSQQAIKKAATTSCEAPKASTRNGANAIPTLASLMTECSTLRVAEDSGKKLQRGTQHSQPHVEAHLPAPLYPCVFCAGWHWPEECRRFPRASQRRGILRRNGFCVRCMRALWPHHGTFCHDIFLPCRGCGKTNHHYAVCLTAFGTTVSHPPSTTNKPTMAAKSIAATERTPRTTKDSDVSSSASTMTVQPPTHKATVKPPTIPISLTQTSSPASNNVNAPQSRKQESSSSKSQVHTRSTLWKTPDAPCAPSEQAVKADVLVKALPTATLTAEVIQVRKASCLATEAVVPSVVTHNVSMKLVAISSSTLCAAAVIALPPTLEGSAQDTTVAGTGSTHHTSDPSATIGIHSNGRKRKAEDNARLANDGQTEISVRTPAASTSEKNEKTSPLQSAPSSGTGAEKQADASEARKGATSTSQDRPKQAPKRIKPTTTGTNNHPEVTARAVPSVKLRDTASKRQPSGDSSALKRAEHSASALSDKQADPSEAVKGATSEASSHCPEDADLAPPRVTPQTNGRIQTRSANVPEWTNNRRDTSDGCTQLSVGVHSTVPPKGMPLERTPVCAYNPKAASSLVSASVENGISGLSKPNDGGPVTDIPPLASSSTDWAARFNDVARRAREDAQKTLAEGLQKLFEQTQILETGREEIFEVERTRLDDERKKLTEMKADISKRRQDIKIKEMKLSTKERRLRDMEQKLNADQRSVDVAREDLVIDRMNMEEERRERIDALPNYEQHVQNERILAEYRLQLEAKEARLQQRAQELEGVFVDLQQQKAAFEEDKLQQASASKSRSRSPHSSSRRSIAQLEKSEAASSSSRRYSSLRDAEEEICRLKRRLKSARDDVDDAHRELRCVKEKRGDENPRRRDAIAESLRKQLDEAKQKHRAQEETLSRAKSERCAAEMKAHVAEKTLAEQKAAHTEKVEGLTTEIEILRWSLEFRRQRSERKIKEAKARKQQQVRQKRGVPAMSAATKSGTVETVDSARVRVKPEVCDDGYGDASSTPAAPRSGNGPGIVPDNRHSSDQTVLSTLARRKLEFTTQFPAKLVDQYLAFLNANVTMAVHVRELVEFLKQKDPENQALSEAIMSVCDEALEDHTV